MFIELVISFDVCSFSMIFIFIIIEFYNKSLCNVFLTITPKSIIIILLLYFLQTYRIKAILIPLGIIIAFTFKGVSLYLAKVIMIIVGEEVKKSIQIDMTKNLIKADTETIEKKHSGKLITNLIGDVNFMTTLVSVGILNLFKDSLTLIGLLGVMFYQNWKLSLIAIVMIPLASFFARLTYVKKIIIKVFFHL